MLRPSFTLSRDASHCRVRTLSVSKLMSKNRKSNNSERYSVERLCFSSLSIKGLNSELEELMVEGLLLQVSLPQVHSLYHILLDRANSQHPNRPASPPEEEPSDQGKHMQFISQGTNMALNQVKESLYN